MREDISGIRHNNRCVKRKLTGVVDAFLREACDRIENTRSVRSHSNTM